MKDALRTVVGLLCVFGPVTAMLAWSGARHGCWWLYVVAVYGFLGAIALAIFGMFVLSEGRE